MHILQEDVFLIRINQDYHAMTCLWSVAQYRKENNGNQQKFEETHEKTQPCLLRSSLKPNQKTFMFEQITRI